MANVDAPRGLKWVKSLLGHSTPPMFPVKMAVSTTVYQGGIVELTVGTGQGQAPAGATTVNTGQVIGVSTGYNVNGAADIVYNFPVIAAAGQIFEIQAGDSSAALHTEAAVRTAIAAGTRYGFKAGTSGVTGLGQSAMELDADASGTTAGTHIFIIHDFVETPDNTWGENMNLQVRFADLELVDSWSMSEPVIDVA